MNTNTRAVESLHSDDLVAFPLWEYVNDDTIGETAVRPVTGLPVDNLTGKVVGTKVCLNNGQWQWALITNVDVHNPRSTEHFLTIALEKGGQWFHLGRYHDVDYDEKGPEALESFLGLSADAVFPISYDLRQYVAKGDKRVLTGKILREPRERLTRSQLIAMAVP